LLVCFFFFFFNDTATTEIYTLSLHDALPISSKTTTPMLACCSRCATTRENRSEEHTSELQSLTNLVCRLLLERKKMTNQEKKAQNCATLGSRLAPRQRPS